MGLDLKGTVSLDGSGFEAGLSRLEHAGKHAFSELKMFALEAFGVYAAGQMFHKSIEDAKELVTAAKRLGTESVEDLQVLRKAAKDSMTGLGSIESAFEKIRLARSKALGGDKGALGAFGAIGVGPQQLQGMTAEKLFMGPLANAARKMNPEDSAAVFREIIGKGFGEVLPVLKADFNELHAAMANLGSIMDTKTAKGLVVMEEELSLLSEVLIAKLAPAILSLAEIIYKAVAGIASTVAGIKGGTSQWKTKDWMLAGIPAVDLLNMIPGLRDHLPSFLKIAPFNFKGAKDAGVGTLTSWEDTLKAIKERIEELLKGGEQKREFEVPDAKENLPRGRLDSADSLVRVGNFLGDSQGALESIARLQLNELKKITHALYNQRNGSTTQQDPAFA